MPYEDSWKYPQQHTNKPNLAFIKMFIYDPCVNDPEPCGICLLEGTLTLCAKIDKAVHQITRLNKTKTKREMY